MQIISHSSFCLGDKTLFKGISKLLPGHYILVPANGRISFHTYWDLDFTVDFHHTEEYFQETLSELLRDSVRLQLRADVPVGAHLSGGLDSTTLACLSASLLDQPIHTFSGGFKEGSQFDETYYARIVADRIHSNHHEIFTNGRGFHGRFECILSATIRA